MTRSRFRQERGEQRQIAAEMLSNGRVAIDRIGAHLARRLADMVAA